jgi:hypothetical protein
MFQCTQDKVLDALAIMTDRRTQRADYGKRVLRNQLWLAQLLPDILER